MRGIHPSEALETAVAVLDAGFSMVEIPLNSPQPFDSVARLADALSSRGKIGAGTVLHPEQVQAVATAGGDFIVSPNFSLAVVRATKEVGLDSYPGVFSATECFAALEAGADALKIFPAEIMGPSGVRALRAVLPPEVRIFSVGGADPSSFAAWHGAGTDGFGIGSYLYAPGRSPAEVRARADECVAAYDALPAFGSDGS